MSEILFPLALLIPALLIGEIYRRKHPEEFKTFIEEYKKCIQNKKKKNTTK